MYLDLLWYMLSVIKSSEGSSFYDIFVNYEKIYTFALKK